MLSNKFKSIFKNNHPNKILIFGYLSYTTLGWILLSLPFSQTIDTSALDNLFTATSAVSTTGLTTIDIGTSYSFIGELIILLLIQIGGIGYMTFGSFIILVTRHKISSFRRDVCRKTFALPHDFNIAHFIRLVIVFTLICEAVGAIALYGIFVYNGEDNPLWSAIFHSVSAFCTAGFSLNSDSLSQYADNPFLNIVIVALSCLGGIGFIVISDLWHSLTGRRKHIHFTSKVILQVTFWFSVIGTLSFYIIEPTIQKLEPAHRLLVAFFQVMSANTTAGFNTIDIGSLSMVVIVMLYLFMIFGASPSGTGGGLKSTTLAALWGLMRSTLKGRSSIRYQKREISPERLQMATASFVFYMSVLFVAVLLLLYSESDEPEIILFEAISALGTVGLSMGLSADLSNLGKLIIISLMFMGRVGILTFGIAVSMHDETPEEEKDNELVM